MWDVASAGTDPASSNNDTTESVLLIRILNVDLQIAAHPVAKEGHVLS